ncbi:uncharacterized protein LOC116210527 [Punica granatum]|uniref:Hyccin n=2 Tax=Punica granatum TaxID=22663 RepID=A0A218W8F7_PUNGR|nr:uncharacterized protein LOC116210527 [Punica granatum]OWM69075.1 hypothetical protein CDL15_Pgr025262 [Punica granatum]PKI73302.1 hypothetical protein CRG98_006240 [Punica granatum]
MDTESPSFATPETTTPAATSPLPGSPTASSSISTTTSSSITASVSRAQTVIESLSAIITDLPSHIASSDDPAQDLLHNEKVATQISDLLRQPGSGAGDNPLCRWLYDTFQTTDPALQLVVLHHLPTIAGTYLSRVAHDRSLAGFEAVLLALYAHETTARGGQSVSVNVPDLSHPSVYHESKEPSKSNATGLHLAVISPSLEPYGTVRSTRRARIIGVALELYYSKISQMPIRSKTDFCEFCEVWAGLDGSIYDDGEEDDDAKGGKEHDQADGEAESRKEKGRKEAGRITLLWELLQPVLRILGHCLLGPVRNKELQTAASAACRSLYTRALHDINPKAILATESLLRLSKMSISAENEADPTEISQSNIIIL